MNKIVNLAIVVVVALTGLAVYWYVKPQHMPQFLFDLVPALKAPRSPMTNFRAPQF